MLETKMFFQSEDLNKKKFLFMPSCWLREKSCLVLSSFSSGKALPEIVTDSPNLQVA